MKFASFLTLAILGILIGCKTSVETETTDANRSNNTPNESEVALMSNPGDPDADTKTSPDPLGGGAKNALDNALASARADSKKLLVHFGSPG